MKERVPRVCILLSVQFLWWSSSFSCSTSDPWTRISVFLLTNSFVCWVSKFILCLLWAMLLWLFNYTGARGRNVPRVNSGVNREMTAMVPRMVIFPFMKIIWKYWMSFKIWSIKNRMFPVFYLWKKTVTSFGFRSRFSSGGWWLIATRWHVFTLSKSSAPSFTRLTNSKCDAWLPSTFYEFKWPHSTSVDLL